MHIKCFNCHYFKKSNSTKYKIPILILIILLILLITITQENRSVGFAGIHEKNILMY